MKTKERNEVLPEHNESLNVVPQILTNHAAAMCIRDRLMLWFGWRFTRDGFFFLKSMIETDLLARTGSSNFEGHQFPFSFYYDTVFGDDGFIYHWQLLICAVGILGGLLWMWKKKAWNREVLEQGGGLLLWFLLPFLAFSAIGTKLIWY